MTSYKVQLFFKAAPPVLLSAIILLVIPVIFVSTFFYRTQINEIETVLPREDESEVFKEIVEDLNDPTKKSNKQNENNSETQAGNQNLLVQDPIANNPSGESIITNPDTGSVLTQFEYICPGTKSLTQTISGEQFSKFRDFTGPSNTFFDARTALWNGLDDEGEPITWLSAVKGGGTNNCWTGGAYYGVWDDTNPSITWEDPYHHAGAFTFEGSNFLVEGFRVDNQGDGIRPTLDAENFHIRGVYLTDIHDDCIENDKLHPGLVDDSYMECYVGYSNRPVDTDSTSNGAGEIVSLTNNLIRLLPQPTVFKGVAPGHGGFFKIENDETWRNPKYVLHNNIFRVEQVPNHQDIFDITASDIDSCSNNIIIWAGAGAYPGTIPSSCFTLTTDDSIWTNAVSDWLASHQIVTSDVLGIQSAPKETGKHTRSVSSLIYELRIEEIIKSYTRF